MSKILEIREVSAEGWAAAFPDPVCIYDSSAFLSLNAGKCERLALLMAEEGAIRCGIAAGLREGTLHAPFSAPFCAIETSGNSALEHRLRFAAALMYFCRSEGYGLELTFPPSCYSPADDAIWRALLTEAGFQPIRADLNYHIPLHPVPRMNPTARNKASRAVRCGMRFEEFPIERLDDIYAVIKKNREMRGFPLRMTAQDLRSTAPIASLRLFALRDRSGAMVASAVVYRSSPKGYQLIYWGHIDPTPGAMNLLAMELTTVLSEDSSADFLDLGPASDCGRLLPGLARFKQSLGALPTVKPTFRLRNPKIT